MSLCLRRQIAFRFPEYSLRQRSAVLLRELFTRKYHLLGYVLGWSLNAGTVADQAFVAKVASYLPS